MIFNVEKPESDQEKRDLRQFRLELKALLKKGKMKVVEKFKVFAFELTEMSVEERDLVKEFLKKEHSNILISYPVV